MTRTPISDLKSLTKELKLRAFERAIKNKRGHLGGSFSSAEFLVYLYYSGLFNYNPRLPKWTARDYFILSKGHASNVFHEILYDVGFIKEDQLDRVSGHCDYHVPGIEATTGSLGHGLGIAAGIAKSLQIDHRGNKVVCMIGDGELQEGSVWEALMFILQHQLSNMMIVLDLNMLGSEDFTYNTVSHHNIIAKLHSFGFGVYNVSDGHSLEDINDAMGHWLSTDGFNMPYFVILNTIKGKGLVTLENTPKAHHHLPQGEDIEKCRRSLQDE